MSEDHEEHQHGFFNLPPAWEEHWRGMPAFHQENLESFQAVKVHFRNPEDREAFAKLIGQRMTERTLSVWFPANVIDYAKNACWTTAYPMNPQCPIYIISKGRWESRLTSKALERMKVPYHIVVEPQEHDQYAAVIDEKKILTLPFSNLGQGSIPARNWVWEHALKRKAARHWILDDNIRGFYRCYDNREIRVECGNIFRAAEDFVNRYTNVAISGFQYYMFLPRKTVVPPYWLNTRIYSCILIKNDIPYRWRGRYNEDTDLSLCALKDGWCTILFNAFLAYKLPTMKMKGGNTDELYKDDGRLKMAESLQEQHPDVVDVSYRWNRWQHSVDYRLFKKNKLKLRPGVVIPDKENNYKMVFKEFRNKSKEEGS